MQSNAPHPQVGVCKVAVAAVGGGEVAALQVLVAEVLALQATRPVSWAPRSASRPSCWRTT